MKNPFGLAVGYFRSVIEESRKVIWPSRALVIKHTMMVTVASALAAIIFGGLDYGLSRLLLLALK